MQNLHGFSPPAHPGGLLGLRAPGSTGFAGGPQANTAIATAVSGRADVGSGIFGGAQIGYNMQFGGFVAGIEADLQTMGRGRTDTTYVNTPVVGFPANPIIGTVQSRSNFNYFGTIRGRAGFAFNNLLVYATAGYAYGERNERSQIDLGLQAGAGSFITLPFGTTIGGRRSVDGYVLGGGLEYALSPQRTVKGEALYYDLGGHTRTTNFDSFTSFTTPPALFTTTSVTTRVKEEGWIGRIGLNYRFNWF